MISIDKFKAGDFVRIEADTDRDSAAIWDRAQIISINNNHLRIKSVKTADPYAAKRLSWWGGKQTDDIDTVKVEHITRLTKLEDV